MAGLPGPDMDDTARYIIQDLRVGGIILFKRNIVQAEQVAALIQTCQELSLKASGYPLLVAVDQEGGPVQRFRHPFPEMPSARQFGEAGDLAAVATAARQVAEELRRLGVTMNLAPVLDVPRSPACPLWERGYSSDPERVADFGLAAIKSYLAGGILPVVKHFPGLGATALDSHVDLPTAVTAPAEQEKDLAPFRKAIAAGVPGVMSAHVLIPEWDNLPASLSPVATTGVLREQLGFTGLACTDDLEMGAITKKWPVAEAARLAVAAGQDVILICEQVQHMIQALAGLAASPDLEARFQAAWTRILAAKQRLWKNPSAFCRTGRKN